MKVYAVYARLGRDSWLEHVPASSSADAIAAVPKILAQQNPSERFDKIWAYREDRELKQSLNREQSECPT